MNSMQAVCRLKYGRSEAVSVSRMDIPEPGPGEYQVKIHATTVNRTDCALLTASPLIMRFITGVIRPRNPVLGTDFAGVISKSGPGTSKFAPGDRVWGFNDSGISTQAEFMTIHEKDFIARMPDNIRFTEAAASIEGAHYARNFINKVTPVAGQKVLVIGGTGAIGSAMIQMLKALGLSVTTVCRGMHEQIVRNLGAEDVIDYKTEDFTKRTGEQFDYIFDAVGKSTFGECRHLLKKHGIYISSELGPYIQNPLLALITPLAGGKKVKFPFPFSPADSLEYVRELINRGTFKPLIDRQYTIDEAQEAYAYVLKGLKTGNVILKINP